MSSSFSQNERLGPNLKGFSWGVFNKKGIFHGEGQMMTFCMNVVFSDLILTDLIFSLITDSVVIDSQRLSGKSWPQLWSQTPHIWENWIWVTTSWRTQEWSCCVLDWRVQTVDWRLWGQVLKSFFSFQTLFLIGSLFIWMVSVLLCSLSLSHLSLHSACQSRPPHQLHSPALTCSWALRKCH